MWRMQKTDALNARKREEEEEGGSKPRSCDSGVQTGLAGGASRGRKFSLLIEEADLRACMGREPYRQREP